MKQYYPDTRIRKITNNERELQTNISDEHRCKHGKALQWREYGDGQLTLTVFEKGTQKPTTVESA